MGVPTSHWSRISADLYPSAQFGLCFTSRRLFSSNEQKFKDSFWEAPDGFSAAWGALLCVQGPTVGLSPPFLVYSSEMQQWKSNLHFSH